MKTSVELKPLHLIFVKKKKPAQLEVLVKPVAIKRKPCALLLPKVQQNECKV